ncbi:MAG TPA: SGNH/GDSL hydrolase family protein [Pseudonocardiaceae bacterium]|nr:SGNH/GDSL hydrolase family protein [Pseudonocardiaceae bacterium]
MDNWTASWGASPVVGSDIPGSTCPAGAGLTNQTVRDVIFLSIGGDHIRIRLTNTFGTTPMSISGASVAVQASGADAAPGTLRELTFHGRHAVTIAAGGREFSDPVALRVAPLSTILVSVYANGPTGPVTNHPFTAQGNYLATGDATRQDSGAGYSDTPCWMFVDGIDVTAARRVAGTVVAFGDSITDTANTTGNANRRWPDFLARRLNAVRGPTLSVVNAGLGGNRLLADREGSPYYGVAGLTRFGRDALDQTGVRAVILLEGINDIGFSAPAADIIAGYQQVIAAAHARRVPVFGATLTPMRGSIIFTDDRLRTWLDVNTWIRTSGAFDGVIDFAAATADPADPTTLNPAYDSGDHLHPDDAGTLAMADAINLRMLLRGCCRMIA